MCITVRYFFSNVTMCYMFVVCIESAEARWLYPLDPLAQALRQESGTKALKIVALRKDWTSLKLFWRSADFCTLLHLLRFHSSSVLASVSKLSKSHHWHPGQLSPPSSAWPQKYRKVRKLHNKKIYQVQILRNLQSLQSAKVFLRCKEHALPTSIAYLHIEGLSVYLLISNYFVDIRASVASLILPRQLRSGSHLTLRFSRSLLFAPQSSPTAPPR